MVHANRGKRTMSHFLATHDVIDETLINRYDEIQVFYYLLPLEILKVEPASRERSGYH